MFNILVVEDDTNTRKLIAKLLRKSGFEPHEAEDGLAALALMERIVVDLVVVDIMMPKMDGFEFAKLVRNSWANMPILMVTAKHEPVDKKQAFLIGTDDYLTKPFEEEELVLRIKALLRRAKIATEHKLTIGDVILDYDALTVQQGDELSTLPQKEFYLLFKLLSYPNIIFTRLQLMDEIWGYESDSSDHTINVHINRLRDRFKNCREFEIVTVRGLGYKAVRKDGG